MFFVRQSCGVVHNTVRLPHETQIFGVANRCTSAARLMRNGLKACFKLIVRPIGCAFLSWETECRDREADRRQFHTESQNVRQPYDVSTIISRHMQGSRKTVMQNFARKNYTSYGSRTAIVRSLCDFQL